VACYACGAVVLRRLQAQHHLFHQRHGRVEVVEFSLPLDLQDEGPASA